MKISPKCPRDSRDKLNGFTELFKVKQGFAAISLVGSKPDEMKKYGKRLISDLDNLFHVIVNPSPTMLVDCAWSLEPTPLTMLELKDQYKFIQTLFDPEHNPFGLTDLYRYFDECIIVPERTAKGVIHIHLIARLSKQRLQSDICRMFWQLFGVKLEGKGQAAIDRFEAITDKMVCVKEVTDGHKLLEYLFNKDKKDYEAIMNLKVNGVYCFQPMALFVVDKRDEAC